MKTMRSNRGFAAIAAMFLVVVLAALGAYMVAFSNTQQVTSAQDIQGTRAYWAARFGLEWAISSVPAGSTACWSTTPPASRDGFALAVSCSVNTYAEGAATVYIFQLTSVASAGTAGSLGYIERSVSASVER